MLIEAINMAKNNPIKNLPKMGAVIAKRSKILGVGVNSHKSDPLQFRFAKHPLAICKHAEIAAIKNAIKNNNKEELIGSSIYIARVMHDGTTSLAKPCVGCYKAITAYGISNVYWTV